MKRSDICMQHKAAGDVLFRKMNDLGYTQHRYNVFTKPLADGVQSWISLRITTELSSDVIFPQVGVRFERLQTAYVNATGGSDIPPTTTLVCPLSSLLPKPDALRWRFTGKQDELVTARLIEDIQTLGGPWTEQRSSVSGLGRALDNHEVDPDTEQYHRVFLHVISNDHEAASGQVEQYLDALEGEEHIVATTFRSFASKFQQGDFAV